MRAWSQLGTSGSGNYFLDAGVLIPESDEAPPAYKDIRQVLHEQSDLVEVLATFRPRVVLMAAAGGGLGGVICRGCRIALKARVRARAGSADAAQCAVNMRSDA